MKLDNVHVETVLSIEHYTDRLFSFRSTRPKSFRFRSGEFVMISLPNLERPVFRAYSIASPSWDDGLEFFSIKAPQGLFTPHLQKIKAGDSIFLRPKSTGTLVLDALKSGKRLFMISTGTGIAPFASLIRDPETYQKFDQIILAQTCRDTAELTYGKNLIHALPNDALVGEYASNNKVLSFFSTTREESSGMGRITNLIKSGDFYTRLRISSFDPADDRIMCCGSVDMLNEIKLFLQSRGFQEGSLGCPNSFTLERAFAG